MTNNNYLPTGKPKRNYDEIKIVPKPVCRSELPGSREVLHECENVQVQKKKVSNPNNKIFVSFKQSRSKDPVASSQTQEVIDPYDAMKFKQVDYYNTEVFKRH